jgi:hypothetical protein
MVLLQRTAAEAPVAVSGDQATAGWKVLEQFAVPSAPGSGARPSGAWPDRGSASAGRPGRAQDGGGRSHHERDRHGNHNRAELPVDIAVLVAAGGGRSRCASLTRAADNRCPTGDARPGRQAGRRVAAAGACS